ncbi:Tim44 domain-containing protein [Noviherbaspirillum pedocola]|uniref:Tim44 domain-containing protein n=1 Tax=Noviherbaspirillum pedocola TaxID=2801341 RepID=A0A934ST81_9BURK|nr:Tim44-like domain-containing protein [Noviherbaspirillum pedocola]MBK4734793.1 Tim44 domain-containing protein [Noviherbaspirillum pedocola]
MKRMLISLMLMFSLLAMAVADADAARRLGGGRSVGRQSENVTRSAPYQPATPSQQVAPRPSAPPATPTPIPPRPASPWRNMLGGALLGLGLGALLSHFGMGGALASMISTILTVVLLGLVLMFILRLFRRKDAGPAPAYAGGYASGDTPGMASRTPEIGSGLSSSAPAYGTSAAPAAPWGVPADFDVPAFLRNAKSYFIRLQAAWDKADVEDIREFTTPEMFAELRLQIQERGPAPNNTDVVQLNADLLGIETSGRDYLASVRFTGLIKEAPEESAAEFAEVWNLSKPLSGQGGWVLAGIQQLS